VNQRSFDFDGDGESRKQDGAELVGENNRDWMDQAFLGLQRFVSQHREFTGEEFRAWWVARQAGELPRHHNAWGALFLRAAREGLIFKTGRYVNARSPRTHAHPVSVWRTTQ
jgi:hypothetical protein